MGGGNSKQQLLEQLESKEKVILSLQNKLAQSSTASLSHTPIKSHQISDATLVDGTERKGPQEQMIKKLKNERRLEVSAEVMSRTVESYEKTVFPKSEDEGSLIRHVILENLLFCGLKVEELDDCVDAFKRQESKNQECIISQGDVGDYFYVLESGQLDLCVTVREDSPSMKCGVLTSGMGFGELALLYNTPRAATITVVSDKAVLWALSRKCFREICIHHEQKRRLSTLAFLNQIEQFKTLKPVELDSIAAAMEWEIYPANTTIVCQGEVGNDFYLIAKGTVRVEKTKEVVTVLGVGNYFGQEALLKGEVRNATCVAEREVTCLTLGREHFNQIVGHRSLILDINNEHIAEDKTELQLVPSSKKRNIVLEDLEIMETLGLGGFGCVKLAKHRETKETYALKILAKETIVSNNLTEHVINEGALMYELDHPFILHMYNSFQDSRYIYFLLELALGGELFTQLQTLRPNEKSTKFYVGSVILAFEHMHERGIIYRDLKPENLVLDSQGYVKVVDFGLSKKITSRTFTLCGTPEYLAPEIILNKGHDESVDYWTIGILLYELCTGDVPFSGQDVMSLYKNILKGYVAYPHAMTKPCRELISKLLCTPPTRRLGNLKGGIRDIVNHKWFNGFGWSELIDKSMVPPIVPKVDNNSDTSNFDTAQHSEPLAPESDWTPDF